jgi:hypothetical protein
MSAANERKSILFTAESYGWGPSAKMVTIARNVPQGVNVTILARGTVAEHARMNGFKVVEYTGPEEDADRILGLTREHDAVLTAGNWELAGLFTKSGRPTLYIDVLFYYWTVKVWKEAEPGLYYCQNFPGTREALEKTAAPFKERIQIVGPIVDTSFRELSRAGRKYIIVNYGGLESGISTDPIKVGQNSDYPFQMADAFLDSIRACSDLPIVVTTGQRIVEQLRSRYSNYRDVTFVCNSQEEQLRLLAQSVCLFTTSGIESTYEACLYDVPVFFLPPSNLSQYCQYEAFKKNDIAEHRVEWADLMETELGKVFDDPKAQLKHSHQALQQCVQSPSFRPDARHSVHEKVQRFFEMLRDPAGQLGKQRRFMDWVGPNAVGEITQALIRL